MTGQSPDAARAGWFDAGPAGEAPDGTLRELELGGRPVCLARVEGQWLAFDGTCTHEECALADGDLDGAVIVCPCHGSEFDLRTGDVLSPPALEPLPVYPVRVEDGLLQIGATPLLVADRDLPLPRSRATAAGLPLEGLSLEEVDLTDLDRWVEGVPHTWFALLRRTAPLHWQDERDGRGFWSFTRYEDIVAVSKDYASYSSETGGTSLQDLRAEELEDRKSMIDTDPPRHTRLRAIVNQGFTPRVVNAYEARIRGLAREILGRAVERQTFDWVAQVASEIPMWVFSEIMGLPVEDRRLLIDLGDRLLGNTDPELMGDAAVAEVALRDAELRKLPFASPYAAELMAYGRELGAARRRDPREDITTKLVEAEVEGERLTAREFETFFILLTTAGNETTRHTISLGLQALFDHPDERERLLRDPSLVPTAADEILRWAHPVHHFRRTATRQVEAHGQAIEPGDKVVIWYASGNFDESKFSDPYRFDVAREPNRHLTFGLGGPHFCLGAHLARLEVRIWLEEMIPYLDRLEPAGPPDRLRSNFFNGIKRLPVQVAV
jgi:cytochrome P450/nitrite reductase/ring-hydroxylating ferredoxin subunit